MKFETIIENALAAGEVLLQFLNDILDSGKLDIEKLEIISSLINFQNLLKRSGREKGLTRSVCYISNKLTEILNLDMYRMSQVLMNLVGNAIKFTATGKISKLFMDSILFKKEKR